MNKETKYTILMYVCMMISLFFAVFSTYTEGYLAYRGAAVDDDGNVFIGTGHGINVYNNASEKLYRIVSVPNGYDFTIRGDMLYIKNTDSVAVCTKKGDVIERIYYSENENLPDYMKNSNADRRRFISETGDVYKLRIKGLRLSVIKNGDTIVYREPWTPAIMRFALKISIAGTVAFAGAMVYLDRKAKMRRDGK